MSRLTLRLMLSYFPLYLSHYSLPSAFPTPARRNMVLSGEGGWFRPSMYTVPLWSQNNSFCRLSIIPLLRKTAIGDISRWSALPSYPFSMLHRVVSDGLHRQFGWNVFTTCLVWGGGRKFYRQCSNKVTLTVASIRSQNQFHHNS